MHITLLGTGTSHGVPSIDCMLSDHARCPKGNCRKSLTDPRHRRTRCSIIVEYNGSSVLIDVSADFREQMLRERVKRIDAVLMTHRHADHIAGIPDIRSYTKDRAEPLDMYGSGETLDAVKQAFGYVFDPGTFVGGGIPRLGLKPVDGPFDLFGETVTPIRVEHGDTRGCFGYRIGAMAYIPDMKAIDASQVALLEGLDVLILNCLRIEREHSTHLLLSESMNLARRLRPRRCIFVHMCHDIDYEADSALLDPCMEFGWDGMRVECEQ